MIRCTCSSCGSDDIREVDTVISVIPVTTFRMDPDTRRPVADDFGDAKVDWNSQRVDDEEYPYLCGACDKQLSDSWLPDDEKERAEKGEQGLAWLVVETIADPEPAAPVGADVARVRNALTGAEEFITGFEDDQTQVGIADMLTDIGAAFGELSKLVDERDTAQQALFNITAPPVPEFLGRDACLAAIASATETIVSLTRINTGHAAWLRVMLAFVRHLAERDELTEPVIRQDARDMLDAMALNDIGRAPFGQSA